MTGTNLSPEDIKYLNEVVLGVEALIELLTALEERVDALEQELATHHHTSSEKIS